jgi:hypothetical protein
MSKNPVVVKRDGQIVTVNTNDLVRVDESDVELCMKAGHHILRIITMAGDDVYWRTKDVDGYTRDVGSVAWDKKISIYPYETDQAVWAGNVVAWFQGAYNNEEYMNLVKSKLVFLKKDNVSIDDLFKSAATTMANRAVPFFGSCGNRMSDIDTWFRTSNKSFIKNYRQR